jgi:hypothetical protein
MKKLAVLAAGVLCFIFVSCGSKPAETPAPTTETTEETQEHKHDGCKMTDEQKAACEAFCKQWADWANLTDDVKQELIAKKKECFDKQDAEKAEIDAKVAECKAAWANFDKLTLDEQKALIDKRTECEKKCCKKGDKKCCKEGKKEGEHKCDAKKNDK